MDYLYDIKDLGNKLFNNKASEFLRKIGYSCIMMPKFLVNDFLFENNTMGSIFRNLVKMTFLRKPLGENCLEGEGHRKTILEQVKMLENMPQANGPIFVYAHLMMPHRPYIFDQNGTPTNFYLRFSQLSTDKRLFLDQLIYTNKLIINLVDKIISGSKVPPIIIIQGDHGPHPFYKDNKDNLKLRMSILNAYLLPKSAKQGLYNSITPVNSFRLLMGEYFGINIGLLEDKNYFAIANYYNIVEITKDLR